MGCPPLSPEVIERVIAVPVFDATKTVGADGASAGIAYIELEVDGTFLSLVVSSPS